MKNQSEIEGFEDWPTAARAMYRFLWGGWRDMKYSVVARAALSDAEILSVQNSLVCMSEFLIEHAPEGFAQALADMEEGK